MTGDINVKKIKGYLINVGITEREFARKCSIKLNELRKILQGRKDFFYDSLCRIADLLDIEVCDLIVKNIIEIPQFYKL